MNDRQENKLTMAKTVEAYLTAHAAETAGVPMAATELTNLTNSIAAIDGYRETQEGTSTGTTMDKKVRRDAAIESALVLIGPMKAYAQATDNNTLLAEVDFSKSDLEDQRDTTLAVTLLNIRDAAQANLAAATPYGVTATKITDLTTKRAAYIPYITAPREKITEISVATANIGAEFVAMDEILVRMDGVMENFRYDNVSLYDGYKSARIIVDLGENNPEIVVTPPEG